MNLTHSNQTLFNVLRAKDLQFEQLPEGSGAAFGIRSGGGVSMNFLAGEEAESLLCTGCYELRVGEDRLAEVAEATNRINLLQIRGLFALDFSEGRVVARYRHWIGSRAPTREEWEEVLDVTILGMFAWYPVFARIVQTDDLVSEVIRSRVQELEEGANASEE